MILGISADGSAILLYFEKDFINFKIDYPGALTTSISVLYDKCAAHFGKQMKQHDSVSVLIPAGTTCLYLFYW